MRFDRQKFEAHAEVFLKFFTVEVLAGLIILFASFFWFRVLGGEHALLDFRFRLKSLFHSAEPFKKMRIVYISEADYRYIQQNPDFLEEIRENFDQYTLPRRYLAELIEIVEELEPRLIVLDVLLDRKSLTPGADEKLAEVLHKYKNIIFATDVRNNIEFPPLQEFMGNSGKIRGHVNFLAEGNTVRRVKHLLLLPDSTFLPSLAFAAYISYQNPGWSFRQMQVFLNNLAHPHKREPGNAARTKIATQFLLDPILIPYTGLPEEEFFIDESRFYFQGIIRKSWVKDKIILIGAGYQIGKDAEYHMPFVDYSIAGVFIHAYLIRSFFENQFLKEPGLNGVFLFIGVVTTILFVLFLKYSYKKAVLLGLTLLLLYWLTNILLFIIASIYFPLSWPTNLIVMVLILQTFLAIYKKESEEDYIRRFWGPYVPDNRLTKIIKEKNEMNISPSAEGKFEIITVLMLRVMGIEPLFCDISNPEFSSKTLYVSRVRVLDRLLQRIQNDIVFHERYNGVVEKFLGNTVFYYFGLPVGDEDRDEALRAIGCAVEIFDKFDQMKKQDEILQKSLPEIGLHILIHTDSVVIGSVHTKDYRSMPTLISGFVERMFRAADKLQDKTAGEGIYITSATLTLIGEEVVECVPVCKLPEMDIFRLKKMRGE